MTKKDDTYGLTGVDPDIPTGHKRFDITETDETDGFLIDHVDNVTIVTLSEANIIDAVEIDRLGVAIESKLKSQDTPSVVIDLKNVTHLSSAALGMFLKLRTFAIGRGGAIGLCEINDNLMQVFTVTRLDKMLPIHETRGQAIKVLEK